MNELLELYGDSDELNVAKDHAAVAVAPYVHSWYIAIRRQASAALNLADEGFEFEAAPLRRSLIEHVVGLLWLIDQTDEAITSLRHAHHKWVGDIQESISEAGWAVADDESFDVILGTDPGSSSQERNLHFKQRCEEYGTKTLFSVWQIESHVSHPSFTTATAYLAPDQRDGIELVDHPRDFPGDTVWIVASALLVASEAFNDIMFDRPWTTQIAEIDRRLMEWSQRNATT